MSEESTTPAAIHPLAALGQAVRDHINGGATSDAPLWERHYSPDFESIEADGMTHQGIEAVQGKHDWWYANMTVHRVEARGPFLGVDQFALHLEMDMEPKDGSTPRATFTEIALYTVRDGKIVREQFMHGA